MHQQNTSTTRHLAHFPFIASFPILSIYHICTWPRPLLKISDCNHDSLASLPSPYTCIQMRGCCPRPAPLASPSNLTTASFASALKRLRHGQSNATPFALQSQFVASPLGMKINTACSFPLALPSAISFFLSCAYIISQSHHSLPSRPSGSISEP